MSGSTSLNDLRGALLGARGDGLSVRSSGWQPDGAGAIAKARIG